MAFEQAAADVPTDIGIFKIVFTDDLRSFNLEQVVFNALDSDYQLEEKELFDGSAIVRYQDNFLVENTDFTVDYVNGTIQALSTGSMEVGLSYFVEYKFHEQNGRFQFVILNQDDEEMDERRGDLANHLTAQEKSTIGTFLNTLRERAVAEVIP